MRKKGLVLLIVSLLFLVSVSYVYTAEKKEDGWPCNSNSDCKSGKCDQLTSTKKACVGLNFWIGDCTTAAEEANYNYECYQGTIGQETYWSCRDLLASTYSIKPLVKVCPLAGYCTGTKDKVYCWQRKGAGVSCQADKECLSNLCASGSCASGWYGNCTKSGIDITEGWHCKADHTGCISNSGEVRNCRNVAGFEMHCNDVLNSCESGLKLSEGESCTSNSQCNSNLCNANKCALKKSNGDNCISSSECVSNNCWNGKCATVTSSWDGLCGSGLICSNDLLSCISSNGGTVKVCATGKYCKPSTSGDGCVVKKISGQTCVSSVECANNICQSGKCGKADGSSCGASSECASNDCFGNMCRSNSAWVGGCSFVNTCSADETRCSISTQGTQICNTNYFCKSGECFLKMADGSNCDLNIECNSGSCLNNLCFTPKNNGDSCSSALECKSGFCQNGKCGKLDGSSCTSSNQCASNDCFGSVCRSGSSWIGSCPTPPGTCKDNTKCTISSQGIKTCNIKYYCGNGACIAKGIGGAACSNNFECASGSCAINTKTNTGTCTTVSLKVNGELCGVNSECQSNNCLGGRCVEPLKANGENCILNSQCQSGFCVNSICSILKSNGEVCSSNTECQSNYCDVILSPRVCRPLPTINHLCGINYNCNSEHDKCLPKSFNDPIILCPIGASIPYYCLEAGGSANCGLQKKSNGLGCSNNYECQSNYCFNSVCSTLKSNGESCINNGECNSGNCDTLMPFPNNNKCRPPAITQNTCGSGYVCNDYFNRCLPQDVNNPIINCPISADIPYYCAGPGNSVNCGLQKKSDEMPCSQSYECQSETCVNNKCGSSEPEVCSQDSDCSQGQACNEDNNSCSLDTDSDGNPNVVDTDDDGDGTLDTTDSSPLDPGVGGTPGGGTGGGGSGGGSSGGGGGVSLVPKTCSALGGIVCLGSEECENNNLISNAKETKCCDGSCKSKPVYVLQSDQSVTFVKNCLDTGQTQVVVKDKDGKTLTDVDTLSALGLTSGEYVDAEDYSCNNDLIGEGQPVYGYGILSLLLSLSLLVLFYSLRRKFI